MRTYAINEIFYTLQAEGRRAGAPSVFIRFAGCNLSCSVETHGFDCDTEFMSGRKLTAEEIVAAAKEAGGACRWVVLTGGEPLLQLDVPLALALKEAGYSLAVETNGTVAPKDGVLELLDWVACSPKAAEHTLRLTAAHELRYVRHHGQAIPKPSIHEAPRGGEVLRYISPAWGLETHRNLAWCIELVKGHENWLLSTQQHKIWRIR